MHPQIRNLLISENQRKRKLKKNIGLLIDVLVRNMSTMPIVAFLYHQSNLSDKMCDSKSFLKMEEEDMKELLDKDADAVFNKGKFKINITLYI